MNIYIIIYLGLQMLGLGISLAQHGEPKKGNNSLWPALIATVISLFLLYKAGLFN
jgi:hypothetical protein